MTPLRAVICVVLFGIVMFGFNYLLHYALDEYGRIGLAVAGIALVGTLLAACKLVGVDFN